MSKELGKELKSKEGFRQEYRGKDDKSINKNNRKKVEFDIIKSEDNESNNKIVFNVGYSRGVRIECVDEFNHTLKDTTLLYFRDVSNEAIEIDEIPKYELYEVLDVTEGVITKFRTIRLYFRKKVKIKLLYEYDGVVLEQRDIEGFRGDTRIIDLEVKDYYWHPETEELKIKITKNDVVIIKYSHINTLIKGINEEIKQLDTKLKEYKPIKEGEYDKWQQQQQI